jgi:hypothetical protein
MYNKKVSSTGGNKKRCMGGEKMMHGIKMKCPESYPPPQSNDHQSRGPTRGRTKKCGPTGGSVIRQAGKFYQNMRKSCGLTGGRTEICRPIGGRSLDKGGGG